MKKFGVMMGLGLAIGAIPAFATTIATDSCAGPNTSFTPTSATAFRCGDKDFSNFVVSSGVIGTTTVTEFDAGSYKLSFTPSAATSITVFTVSFDIDVDAAAAFAPFYINQIGAQMFTVRQTGTPAIPNGSKTTVTLTPAGTPANPMVLTAVDPLGHDQGSLENVLSKHESISFTFDPGGSAGQPLGKLTSLEFSISQTTVPEPVTFSLMGIGLLGLGLLKKRLS